MRVHLALVASYFLCRVASFSEFHSYLGEKQEWQTQLLGHIRQRSSAYGSGLRPRRRLGLDPSLDALLLSVAPNLHVIPFSCSDDLPAPLSARAPCVHLAGVRARQLDGTRVPLRGGPLWKLRDDDTGSGGDASGTK